ncbi:MAG: cytochrome c [Candidatus Sericytochromatia bacterium]
MKMIWKKTLQVSLGLAVLTGGLIWFNGSEPQAEAASGNAKAGKKVYMQRCATCHGNTGKADGPVGKALTPKPRDFSVGKFLYAKNDAELIAFIKKGKSPMPAWEGTLNPTQLQDVVAFIRTLKK